MILNSSEFNSSVFMKTIVNKQMTQTWNQFLTVSVENGENTNVIEWNSLESYRNTSPGTALKRHKELFPSSKVKVISF